MNVTKATFEAFLAHARKLVPSFEVIDGKRDSWIMNLVDGVVYPFNPGFMDRYITTVITKVYYPKGTIARSYTNALEVAGHELVHAYDAQRLNFMVFSAWYLSAVSLFIGALVAVGLLVSWTAFLPLAAFGAHAGITALTFKLRKVTGFPLLVASLVAAVGLMIYWEGWSALWLAGISVLLAPWPAPGRTWAELRGYGMSVFLEIKLFGKTNIDRKVRQFTGPAYYFMWPFGSYVRKRLEKYETDARAGKIDGPVFLHVQEFLDTME